MFVQTDLKERLRLFIPTSAQHPNVYVLAVGLCQDDMEHTHVLGAATCPPSSSQFAMHGFIPPTQLQGACSEDCVSCALPPTFDHLNRSRHIARMQLWRREALV